MNTWKKKLAIFGAVALTGAVTLAGLTESGLRSALASWMKGDRTVQNAWTEVLDFIVGDSIIVVDTFFNNSGAAIDVASGTGRVAILKY